VDPQGLHGPSEHHPDVDDPCPVRSRGGTAVDRRQHRLRGFGADEHIERALDRRHALAGLERLEDDEHRRGKRRQVDHVRARDWIELAPHLGHCPADLAFGDLPLA